MMKQVSNKYDKVMEILKKSRPLLESSEDIQEKVLREISLTGNKGNVLSPLVDFFFDWININWVRRSLIAASLMLVLFFVYQQSVILKQMNYLSRQIVATDKDAAGLTSGEISRKVLFYKFSGNIFPSRDIEISEKQIKNFMQSVYQQQNEYHDLMDLIEKDPELKKLIEKKLMEINSNKIKL
jgi:hypothetical protein